MQEILRLIRDRQSARVPFDPEKSVSKRDLKQILESARWAPSAHNMQNYEIILVDNKKLLTAISNISSPVSGAFLRENYQQLSFSEEDLLEKKAGLLATMFPPAARVPEAKLDEASSEQMASNQGRLIRSSSALLIVVYDPDKRAPASERDFLGIISLGCMMENMWLTAQSLGIGFQVVSSVSAPPVEKEIMRLLNIPSKLRIAFSVRLGYTARPIKYLRVRRDIADFTHHNQFDDKGLG